MILVIYSEEWEMKQPFFCQISGQNWFSVAKGVSAIAHMTDSCEKVNILGFSPLCSDCKREKYKGQPWLMVTKISLFIKIGII